MQRAVVLALALLAVFIIAQFNWVNYLDVVMARSTCIYDKYVVIPSGESFASWLQKILATRHIYKPPYYVMFIDKYTGKVIKTFNITDNFPVYTLDLHYNCIVAGDYLYAAGYRLYIFDRNLSLVKSVDPGFYVTAIASDGNYIYLAGIRERGDLIGVWHIEKRDLNLTLIKSVDIYSSGWIFLYNIPYDLAINPVSGQIWVVGYYKLLDNDVVVYHAYVVLLDKDLNVVKTIDYKISKEYDIPSSVCFDSAGNAYVANLIRGGVAKFDSRGNLVGKVILDNNKTFSRAVCTYDKVLLIGYEESKDGIASSYIYMLDRDLRLLTTFAFPKPSENSSLIIDIGKTASDGSAIYVAGWLTINKTNKVVLYSIPVVWSVKVVDTGGAPLSGFVVKAVGGEIGEATITNISGVAVFRGVVPSAFEVYSPRGLLVASVEAKPGATAVVNLADQFAVANSVEAGGYVIVRGARFLDGSSADLMYPVEFTSGVAKARGALPLSYPYPVEVYVTRISLGGHEIVLRGGPLLIFKGNSTALAKGLDLAELGLAGVVKAAAVDSAGAVRGDWALEVLYNGTVVARGNGTLTAALPRTSLVGLPYTLRVVTTAKAPDGRPYAVERALAVENATVSIAVKVNTTRVVVAVVDGFGRPRGWPVEVVGVARGNGSLAVELVEGGRYTARASALGFTNATEFTAVGRELAIAVKIPTAVVKARAVDGFGQPRSWPVEVAGAAGNGSVVAEVLAGRYVVKAYAFGREFVREVEVSPGREVEVEVKVPTARITARVVDGFGQPRDWPIEVVGVASGSGAVGPVEVLAGNYTVRATAFGREFVQQAVVGVGQVAEVAVRVPTARLSVAVVDDEGKPLDRYVAGVELAGPLSLSFDKPPRDVEVLAGQYVVKATALGKSAAVNVTVAPGEAKEVKVVVPGTAGIDVGDTRITYGTLAVIAVVIAAAAGATAYLAKRRKK